MLSTFEKIIFLKHIPLFAELDIEGLKILSKIANEVVFSAGEVVFKEGEAGDTLYIIESGKVKVYPENNPDKVYAILCKSECFGEMAVLDRETRSASVAAIETTNLISIECERFRNLIIEYPFVAFPIFATLCKRMRSFMSSSEKGKRT